ncbi:MAG: ABC transporter substrate-binding protein, partial [Desulfobulbaceae bacterium]|nr:ABC transporter substrate-binding protein [Desulfobulbaceae bacterium]
AVCAVRERYLTEHDDVARDVHQTLLACRREGLAGLEGICARVAERIPMDPQACSHYLHAMEYDLGSEKQKALETFFTHLIQRGEADQAALPLKFFS